jgi:hypothetical protein
MRSAVLGVAAVLSLVACVPGKDRTGLTISYEGTGDLDAILGARVQSGHAPDLAGIRAPASWRGTRSPEPSKPSTVSST